ncbi:MAG: NAD(+)/NADH kinase, partial [Defluviitaleaceae bacterium]|nr:NAD(+)/NADH kinase [Defluviitaleaceae bacterium]
MKKIGFITNEKRDINASKTDEIKSFIKSLGHIACESLEDDIDYIIALGGDGTMLAAVHQVAKRNIPLLGINLGRLGYLTDTSSEGALEAVGKLLAGDYKVERRMMLEAEVLNPAGGSTIAALNDIVIHRGQSSRPIHYNLSINGEYIESFCADGVIVATPTGSTAYNLSAGGPLLNPISNMMIITPVCPHMLNAHPIVAGCEDVISIDIDEKE